jgi:hypothetical protein
MDPEESMKKNVENFAENTGNNRGELTYWWEEHDRAFRLSNPRSVIAAHCLELNHEMDDGKEAMDRLLEI